MRQLQVFELARASICNNHSANHTSSIICGGEMAIYQPYWTSIHGQKHKNPAFDFHSNQILNLKHRQYSAIKYFYEILEPLADSTTAIAVVPTHDPAHKDSGIHDLAKLMCKNGLWIDASDCLQRVREIPKLASGGNRSILVHLNSLKIINPEIIKDRNVFLLDDVTTTGNTLKACKIILDREGAKSVNPYAFGETPLYHSKSANR